MSVTKAQVAKGAKLLDEKVPGWSEKINTKKLAMRSNTNCILGQLAKAADFGKESAIEYGETLGLTEKKFASHGFEAVGDFPDEEADKAQAELWKAEIEARKPAWGIETDTGHVITTTKKKSAAAKTSKKAKAAAK
jgi:hypothetical protein